MKFRNLISTISQGKITILSTHIVSDVSYIADDILLVQHGELQYFGDIQQLTTAVEGKVWEVLVENQQANKIAQDYMVSNMNHTQQGAILRIISDHKPFQKEDCTNFYWCRVIMAFHFYITSSLAIQNIY
nr:hypothetical protein [uncultured Blautia sp.]